MEFLKEETYQDYVQKQKHNLLPPTYSKIKKQKELGVPEDRIEQYRQGKIKEREKSLKDRLYRTTIKTDKYVKIADVAGIQFFMEKDDPMLHTPTLMKVKRYIPLNVQALMSMRDVLPIRKPRIVVKSIDEEISYSGDAPPAYYQDRIIYLDAHELSNPDLLIHEYAHYVADLIPKQTEEMLLKEYRKFIDTYFKVFKKKKTYDLEDTKKENKQKLRMSIAKRLGLPSEYAFQNADELFAEIITHWKRIPNNRASYRFKQAMKKVLTRL